MCVDIIDCQHISLEPISLLWVGTVIYINPQTKYLEIMAQLLNERIVKWFLQCVCTVVEVLRMEICRNAIYYECYTILFTILYYTILYYTILYYTILYYTILYYTILYYAAMYCTLALARRGPPVCGRTFHSEFLVTKLYDFRCTFCFPSKNKLHPKLYRLAFLCLPWSQTT